MLKKKFTLGIVTVGAIVLAIAGIGSGISQSPERNSNPRVESAQTEDVPKTTLSVKPLVCNGTTVMSDCAIDGTRYKIYQYHAPVPEKTHTEQVTTYEKKVTGYCTLCSDGTYSPSCATGRGACSWHGGVAQWNAPRYSSVPVYSTKTVVDAPALDAYYEKVID